MNILEERIIQILKENTKKIQKMSKAALNIEEIDYENKIHQEQMLEVLYIILPFKIQVEYKKQEFKLRIDLIKYIKKVT